MSAIQETHKRSIIWKASNFLLDKVGAIIGLSITVLLLPLISILIKHSSKGPIIYKQTRLGKNGKPFILYKFRTMIQHAEKNGPTLSHATDDRITKAGHILRHLHLDELPQFWNVLKGDMSLVGPRPERPYFAEKLKKEAPEYNILLTTKPGLTSLGMIKYGYASNIEEMKERLKYDLLYLNDPSWFKNIKIIIETLLYITKKGILYLFSIHKDNTHKNAPQKLTSRL
ncbi:MAG: hypothetical protein PWQ06_628 [Anaerophaga sp.]|nr:hypothetical protein [Anaerophaga sp.]